LDTPLYSRLAAKGIMQDEDGNDNNDDVF